MRFSAQLLSLGFCFSISAALLATTPPARAQNLPAPSATLKLKRVTITDTQQFNMPAYTGLMPVDWTMTGGLTWNLKLGPPDLFRVHWGDAQDICAFDEYPFINFIWSKNAGPGKRFQADDVTATGDIVEPPPNNQFDAFQEIIVQKYRPDLASATVVNQQKRPDLAQALYAKINTDPGYLCAAWAGSETFEYNLKGQTVDEVISGKLWEFQSKQFGFISWGLVASSERAPKATFDQLQPTFAVISQSLQMNPAWAQQLQAFINQRTQATLAAQQRAAQIQQQQFQATEQRIGAQTAANDAEDQQFNQHMANLDKQSDGFADYERDVTPWQAPDGTTYKLPNNYGNAWQAADGTIIMNNNPNYNPNSDPTNSGQTWTAMQQSPSN
jgi:hypothetical protein